MPLPPLPANSTARVFIDYTSVGVTHTMAIRMDDTPGIAADTADAYATACVPLMREGDSFFAARFQPAGAVFSLPIAFDPIEGLVPNTAALWDEDPESVQYSITFRGVETGRDSALYFYTAVKHADWPTNNRYLPGDSATITAWVDAIIDLGNAAGDFPLQSVGGDHVSINRYANIRHNSYWQTEQRG